MVTGRKNAASKGTQEQSTKKATKLKKEKLIVTERPSKYERTTQEAAILLGLKDPASVRNLYLRGDLKGRLVGRVLWIPLSSIERYSEKRRSPGRPEGSITGESQNKRGPSQTEYQREYKRKLRAGLIKPRRRRSAKKS